MSLLRKCSASAEAWYVCPHGSSAVQAGGPSSTSQASGRSAKCTSCVHSWKMPQRAGALESVSGVECVPHALRQCTLRAHFAGLLLAGPAAPDICSPRPGLKCCLAPRAAFVPARRPPTAGSY